MGKSLIIKGADFSENAVPVQFNEWVTKVKDYFASQSPQFNGQIGSNAILLYFGESYEGPVLSGLFISKLWLKLKGGVGTTITLGYCDMDGSNPVMQETTIDVADNTETTLGTPFHIPNGKTLCFKSSNYIGVLDSEISGLYGNIDYIYNNEKQSIGAELLFDVFI